MRRPVGYLLRPALGFRPWLAFFRRALTLRFCVRFDMAMRGYRRRCL
ncbi:MAG: hypothetical protein KatS3mg008_1881 [Acidimicrobiales bacterium]|nr:MAG: hypothetical protein KatS3mg008_1881 [Acidimicrobiales bacterium]